MAPKASTSLLKSIRIKSNLTSKSYSTSNLDNNNSTLINKPKRVIFSGIQPTGVPHVSLISTCASTSI